MNRHILVFDGYIAGLGTASGTRIVLGIWRRSPFGDFADVMVERADGNRTLLAPSAAVAQLVGAIYEFDEVAVVPVEYTRRGNGIAVTAGALSVTITVGGPSALGRLLRLLPRRLATRPGWLRLIDPVARLLVAGVRTAGSAGGDAREYYGATSARTITLVSATWNGEDLGGLARLHPPVRFGFGSAPASPQLVRVTTTIHRTGAAI